MEAHGEIVSLKETCDAYNEERIRLRRELDSNEEFQVVFILIFFASIFCVYVDLSAFIFLYF